MIISTVLPVLLWALPSGTLPATIQPGHSAWHPADSIVYVELPDLVAARRDWHTTAIGRLIADPEIHTALGALMGMEKLDPGAKLVEQMRTDAPEGMYDSVAALLAGVRAVSVSATPTATTAAALQGKVSDPAEAMGAFGLQVTLSMESSALATQTMDFIVKGLMEDGIESTLEPLEWGGVAGAALSMTGGGPVGDGVKLLRLDKELFLVAGASNVEDLQKRFGGDGSSMATNKAWTAGVSHFGSARGTTVVELYSGLSKFASLWGGMELDPIYELAEGLLGTTGSMVARGGRWRITIDEGIYVSDGYQMRDGSSQLDSFLERGPLSENALAFVNPKALVASAVQFNPEGLVGVIRGMSASEDGDAFSRFEATHGFKLDDMVLALGDSATFSMPNLPLMTAPDVQVSVALKDREKFNGGFTGIVALIGNLLGDKGTIAVKEYRGNQLATISLTFDLGIPGLPVDPTKMFTPTFVALEDRVLITATQSFAKKVVRSAAKGDLDTHEFLSQVSMPEGVAEVGYADWANMVGGLYTIGRSMAGMFASGMEPGTIPFDLNKLPEASLFLRHFKPSLRWERRVDGGMLHHGESSFGPDVMLTMCLAGSAVAFRNSVGVPAMPR